MRYLLILVASSVLWGLPKPDFTGEWRLNAGQSNFARQSAPKDRVIQIDHRDPTLVVTTFEDDTRGKISGTTFYSTEGVERTNEILGISMKSVTKWDGAVLEMRTSGKFGPNDITLLDRYELSSDGSRMTM